MQSTFWTLKEQLKDYGLCPQEWRWKFISPEEAQGILENTRLPGLCIKGEWQEAEPEGKSFQWSHLEWQF